MNDSQKIKRQFNFIVFGFLALFLVMMTLGILAWIYIQDENIRFFIVILIGVGLLALIPSLRRKIDQLLNISFIIRIKENASPALEYKNLRGISSLKEALLKKQYLRHLSTENYELYYRIEKDMIRKTFPKYILWVSIVIKKNQTSFYLDEINSEIDRIVDNSLKDKKRIEKLLITQYKSVLELTDNDKEAIKEIIFLRTNRGIISTINVGLMDQHEKAVLLYSDKFNPSQYYKLHVEEIKHII